MSRTRMQNRRPEVGLLAHAVTVLPATMLTADHSLKSSGAAGLRHCYQSACDRPSAVLRCHRSNLCDYALAAMDTNTLSLVYLGVSKTARNQRISSSLISKLKEGGAPIITDVRSNNTSSMVERFEHFGFGKGDVNADRTNLRWEKHATPARREI